MFAFNEALMDWMTVNDLQQASEMISVSKQFCDIYKNKVKQIKPFIHNSFLHISGKIINLITKQVKHCLDAKFPRYVFNHETKKWIALSDLPQELIKGATSILLKGNILKVVIKID